MLFGMAVMPVVRMPRAVAVDMVVLVDSTEPDLTKQFEHRILP